MTKTSKEFRLRLMTVGSTEIRKKKNEKEKMMIK